ncbi:MAG: FHA domain-containing protein [Calditrichaeota bacterium]|nr:MAG: FHA domain-containing protein [Calditrichota bacterium]
MSRYPKLSFNKVKTYSIKDRYSKVNIEDFAHPLHRGATLEDFLAAIPDILVGKDFREFVEHFRRAIAEQKAVIWMMGAHVIKCGINPLIIELLRRGYITHLAMNGACVIHDVEIAMWGITSEDVAAGLQDGTFGMAKETAGFINGALAENKGNDRGYGEVVGEKLLAEQAPNRELSLLAACVELGIPVSVHPALGTEIIHQHPNLDGAAFGEKSWLDFQVFAQSLTHLQEGSIVLNVGSAVIMPEVFLKALTVVRNLGYPAHGFYTAVFDMIRHYRPSENVMHRPTLSGGKGYYFVGHHELLLPLLVGLLLEDASGPPTESETTADITANLEKQIPGEGEEDTTSRAGETRAYLVPILPSGEPDTRRFPLRSRGMTTIGRQEADIAFPEDQLLSDQHASIVHNPDGYFLRDDGSVNGVYYQARGGEDVILEPGTIVRVGRQFLLLQKRAGKCTLAHYDQEGRQVNLYEIPERFILLGRSAPDIVLDPRDTLLSRRHLGIAIKEGKVILRDLNSLNGTYIKVRNPIPLKHGDRFRLGKQYFEFRLEAPPEAFPDEEPDEDRTVVLPEGVNQLAEGAGEMEVAVTFKGLGKACTLKQGENLCQAARRCGVQIDAECGNGACGSDPVRIVEGGEHLNEISPLEASTLQDLLHLKPGEYRLACMARPTGPVVVELLPEKKSPSKA